MAILKDTTITGDLTVTGTTTNTYETLFEGSSSSTNQTNMTNSGLFTNVISSANFTIYQIRMHRSGAVVYLTLYGLVPSGKTMADNTTLFNVVQKPSYLVVAPIFVDDNSSGATAGMRTVKAGAGVSIAGGDGAVKIRTTSTLAGGTYIRFCVTYFTA